MAQKIYKKSFNLFNNSLHNSGIILPFYAGSIGVLSL